MVTYQYYKNSIIGTDDNQILVKHINLKDDNHERQIEDLLNTLSEHTAELEAENARLKSALENMNWHFDDILKAHLNCLGFSPQETVAPEETEDAPELRYVARQGLHTYVWYWGVEDTENGSRMYNREEKCSHWFHEEGALAFAEKLNTQAKETDS